MNNESFDDLLNRLNNKEKQQVIEYAYMFDDLRYLREHARYLQKQLEAYENMRKEAIEFIKKYCIDDEFYINLTYKEKAMIEVLNILNKVGGNDE